MQTLKINLFGEQWTLKKLECSAEEFEKCLKVADKMKVSIQDALLNPFFYYNLQLPKIQSLEHLPNKKISGLLNSPKNQIEVLLDGKRINKIHFSDLLTLFPIYNTTTINIDDNYSLGIYVEQKAIGFIGSYEFKTEKFDIADLQFNLIELNNQLLLQNITYPNCKTIFKKKETVINYQNSYSIEDN